MVRQVSHLDFVVGGLLRLGRRVLLLIAVFVVALAPNHKAPLQPSKRDVPQRRREDSQKLISAEYQEKIVLDLVKSVGVNLFKVFLLSSSVLAPEVKRLHATACKPPAKRVIEQQRAEQGAIEDQQEAELSAVLEVDVIVPDRDDGERIPCGAEH